MYVYVFEHTQIHDYLYAIKTKKNLSFVLFFKIYT